MMQLFLDAVKGAVYVLLHFIQDCRMDWLMENKENLL